MTKGAVSEAPEPVAIGSDGFAMLALSVAFILLSSGTSLMVAFGYVLWIASRTPHVGPPHARIVVLGARMDAGGGEPTRCYRARLDRARALWLQAPESTIIVLGGRASRDGRSEADAGAYRLRAGGVAADKIETEERSRHTLENLLAYRQRFPIRPGEQPTLVTSRFHLARSSLLATGLGIEHTLCAAEASALPALPELPRMLHEALLIHWYITGRVYARLTGNKRMAARIT